MNSNPKNQNLVYPGEFKTKLITVGNKDEILFYFFIILFNHSVLVIFIIII